MVSTICTGTRIVRAWSARARVIACLIHHVAYVENLYPLSLSNLSTAFIKPILPSWIKSKNNKPLPTYLLAILTTKRKLDSASLFIASSSPCATLSLNSNSSSGLNKEILPISFKYIRTGSLIFISLVSSLSSNIIGSSSITFGTPSSPVASDSSATTWISFSIKVLYISSKESLSTSKPFKASANCSNVIYFFSLPNTNRSLILSSKDLISTISFTVSLFFITYTSFF